MEHGEAGPVLAGPTGTAFRRLAQRHDAATVRTWARSQGMELAPTGGLPRYVYALYEEASAEGGEMPGRNVADDASGSRDEQVSAARPRSAPPLPERTGRRPGA